MDLMYLDCLGLTDNRAAGVAPCNKPKNRAAMTPEQSLPSTALFSKSTNRLCWIGASPHTPLFSALAPQRHSVPPAMPKMSIPFDKHHSKHMSIARAFDCMRKNGNPDRHFEEFDVVANLAAFIQKRSRSLTWWVTGSVELSLGMQTSFVYGRSSIVTETAALPLAATCSTCALSDSARRRSFEVEAINASSSDLRWPAESPQMRSF
mmetsp:Transcript_28653/g.66446  ORF Transcript_28653/g.66446 Transcript_28653/m.66446 type:complete len:207 (+) Transcript_28653:1325-1945(+)